MTCDPFEIAIEQRRRGLLSPEEAAQLDAHMAACDGCTHFDAAARSVEDSLDRHATAESQGIDLDLLKTRIETIVVQHKRRLARTIAEQITLVGFIVWMSTAIDRGARHMWFPALIGMAILAPLAWWSITRDARHAEQIARGEGDILVWWRARLDRQLSSVQRSVWMWPVFSIAVATILWMRHRPGTEWRLAVNVAILAAWTVGVCISTARSFDQLRRERASLQ